MYFAADLTLRWKKRILRGDAHIVNLTRTSSDPNIAKTVEKVSELSGALASAVLDPKVSLEAKEALKQRLEAAQAELRRLSPDYRNFREKNNAMAHEVQAVLPNDSALIEYRFFNPFDFKISQFGKLRLLAAVLRHEAQPVLVDLGEAAPIIEVQQQLISSELRKQRGVSLAALQRTAYDRLIMPLAKHVRGATTVIILPDGQLNALPFDALTNENGELLADRFTVRMVQSGRDLIHERKVTGKGLVAFGDIDFGTVDVYAQAPNATAAIQVAHLDQGNAFLRTVDILNSQIGPFKHLDASRGEVDAIAEYYAEHRPDEPKPVVHKGRDATEARLKKLAPAPRVLHLATHGFYLGAGPLKGQPLLQSGVAMALANNALSRKLDADGENGILQAIEAAGMNLAGTELVVLSACETGLGVQDYSEGLEGLPTAFYVAGAKNVLVTLWKVDDQGTKEFMNSFYRRWLRQTVSDPAAALRETKRFFQNHPTTIEWRDPQIWAAFVLFEG